MIYASTSCLKNPPDIIRVLNEYEKAGIENVELGSVHKYFELKEIRKFNFNFLIHNYFPPPKIPFNFNLASSNKEIKEKSYNLAIQAIDLCAEIESPLYTFHAGFTVDPPKLGEAFPKENITNRKKAISTYIEEVIKIVDHGNCRGIKTAMEPNVVQKFNLVKNKNELSLFAEFPEIEELFQSLNNTKMGLLLDLGHTIVTSYWLNFDKDEFVEKCRNKVFAIHASNNNGLQDQHKSLTKECWQSSKLKKFKNVPITLETMNLTVKEIKENIQLVEEIIN
jgi:sugar phosphate isomerase/epimerase